MRPLPRESGFFEEVHPSILAAAHIQCVLSRCARAAVQSDQRRQLQPMLVDLSGNFVMVATPIDEIPRQRLQFRLDGLIPLVSTPIQI